MKSLFDSILNWATKSAIKGARSLKDNLVLNKMERTINARRKKRDQLVKDIQIAESKGDRKKLEELYIAFHLLDNDK